MATQGWALRILWNSERKDVDMKMVTAVALGLERIKDEYACGDQPDNHNHDHFRAQLYSWRFLLEESKQTCAGSRHRRLVASSLFSAQ